MKKWWSEMDQFESDDPPVWPEIFLKFSLFEKGTKFEKIFHLKFDVTE